MGIFSNKATLSNIQYKAEGNSLGSSLTKLMKMLSGPQLPELFMDMMSVTLSSMSPVSPVFHIGVCLKFNLYSPEELHPIRT